LAFGSRVLAADARYDLVIKGGRVIDPSLRLDGIRDVGVVQGRIAAVESGITAAATTTIDARGKLVVPGLIDIHTHAARTLEGPGMVLADGVTGWIDAGSHGADGIDLGIKVARAAPQQGRLMINVGRAGILPDGDTMDLARADTGVLRDAIAAHRDLIVGIKARLSKGVSANDVETLRRAQQVATGFGLPVMIHMGQTQSPLRAAAELDHRRGGQDPARRARGAAPRRVVRHRLRPRRSPTVGHRRQGSESGFLARHVLDGLERRQQDDRRRRSAELHVEAVHVRHVAVRSDCNDDIERGAHVPGVP
jgi:cytosine/adenosine deaminase-related metal-dependent hydrolase